jgi:hypothetical protein
VRHATALLRDWFDIYDYRQTPETDGNLEQSLREQIASRDVFICVLDEGFISNRVTREELETATGLSIGPRGGLLKDARGKPFVYIVTCDDKSRKWVAEKHPGYTYLSLEPYQFRADDVGFAPERPMMWDNWLKQMRKRLDDAATLKTDPPVVRPTLLEPACLVLLGRPTGSFQGETAAAQTQLLGMLDADKINIADGWYDRRDGKAAQAARTVAIGAPGSLMIQPCDHALLSDNTIEGEAPGDDLRGKLRRDGATLEDAGTALCRTLFWVPRTVAAKAFRALDADAPPAEWPLFGAADPQEVAHWVRSRLQTRMLTLKAEDGIGDIGPALKQRLVDRLGPLEFALFDPGDLGRSIRQAAAERAPLLVAIHDRKIDALNSNPRREIVRRAGEFDALIDEALVDTPDLKVARAVLLVRYADKFADKAFIARKEWTLLPLDASNGYAAPADRLDAIGLALSLPAVVTG